MASKTKWITRRIVPRILMDLEFRAIPQIHAMNKLFLRLLIAVSFFMSIFCCRTNSFSSPRCELTDILNWTRHFLISQLFLFPAWFHLTIYKSTAIPLKRPDYCSSLSLPLSNPRVIPRHLSPPPITDRLQSLGVHGLGNLTSQLNKLQSEPF